MSWTGSDDVAPTTRIATVINALLPSERRVVELILDDTESAMESTAQELADRAGVARSTVVRACQSLGYRGYPQLRVALTREVALGTPAARDDGDDTMLGTLRGAIDHFAGRLGQTTSAMTEETLERFVRVLDEAPRLLIAANGLSSPLGSDLAMRLISAGRPAEYLPDTLGQQIAATHLGPGAACLVLSGSGANRASVDVAAAARASGATVLAITSFPRSAVAELADVALVVAPIDATFRDELVHTSRAAIMLVTESVVGLLVGRRGDRAQRAQSATLAVISGSLSDDASD